MAFTALAPVIGAGITAGGGLLGGVLGQQGAQATNAQSFQQAEMLFDQQQASIPASQQYAMNNAYHMRDTAYQTTVRDMKAAGLNPILAANFGPTGATIGGSGGASQSAPTLQNAGAEMAKGVSSASQAGQVYAQIRAGLAQAEKDKSATDVNETTSDMNRATTDATRKNIEHTGAQIDRTKQDTETLKSNARAADASAMDSSTRAANNVIQGGILEQQRNSATSRAAIDALELEQKRTTGGGFWGDAGTALGRTAKWALGHVVRGAGRLGGGGILDTSYPSTNSAKTVPPAAGPGLTIDMKK